jgi:hypothetical protein
MTAGLAWLLIDAPPIEGDYVEKDVIPKANGSYHYLDLFNKADAKALIKANRKLGEGYSGKISRRAFQDVWEEISNYRAAINTLGKKPNA